MVGSGGRLRVGLVGCGNVALNFHLPAYRAQPDRFEVVGLADPTPDRLELGRTGARLSREQVHLEPRDLVGRDDVDLVDVCTPQHVRRDLLVAAAGAGKHTVCEKPLASVPADAAAAVAAAERAGVRLAVVQNYLFFPEVIAARRLIQAGAIGEVRVVMVNLLGVVDSPGAPGYQPRWRHDWAASGGGVLMDMLHGVYLAEHLLGAPVERVSAYADTIVEGGTVESLALCRLEADRKAALVNIGWGLGHGGIQVVGTSGRMTLRYREDGTFPWAPFEQLIVSTGSGTRVDPLPAGQELRPLIVDSMAATLLDLADAIRDGREPATGGRQGLHTLETTLAAYASAALGRTVAVPLARDGAVYRLGVAGLRELDEVPGWSPARTSGLFGLD